MAQQNFHVLQEVVSLEELCDVVAKLQKIIRHVINGDIDFTNIRARSIKAENIEVGTLTADEIAANTITADRMNVNQLSAIAADLGTITAGLMQAVTMIGSEIYGSYIATADGTYPRAEMSNTLNMFRAMLSDTQWVGFESYDTTSGSTSLTWVNGAKGASATFQSGELNISSELDLELGAEGDIILSSFGDILLNIIGSFYINGWSRLRNSSSGRSMQTEIDDIYSAISTKANAFAGAYGSFETADGKTVTVSNGIIVSVV